MTNPKEYLKDVFRPLLDEVAFSHACAGIDKLEYEKAQVVASDVQDAFACLPEAIEELNEALEVMGQGDVTSVPICTPDGVVLPKSSEDSGLTMEDFADCMATGPDFGEVGYIGDYPQPLEYPCNCAGCTEEWRAESDKLFSEWLKKMTNGVYGDD